MSLKDDFLCMVQEYRAKAEYFVYHDLAMQDFQAYLDECANYEIGKHLKPDHVPQTTYWLVDDMRTIVAESRLRHYLIPSLEIEGGHIGYAVRPSRRLKGVGTELLKQTLPKATAMGISKVLITCNADNIGSQKIILANGGIFDGENISPQSQKWVYRYWINLV